MRSRIDVRALAGAAIVLLAAALPPAPARADTALLNVSYDPTRELYQDYDAAFARYWKKKTGQNIGIRQSHGGSGKQARSVIDGLEADVVTLGLPTDINAIERAGLIGPGWQKRLPDSSTPYTSTVVLVVRRGNPKRIRDWGDLVRPGVQVITPNPKTSAGGRMAYFAAYAYAAAKSHNNPAAIRGFLSGLYHNVPVLDTGARGSTTTFAQRGIGDVLIAWENEALLVVNQLGKGQFQVVYPSVSILAEPSVAVVDRVAAKHHTQDVAAAYLRYLYSPEGQTIVARHYYRPRLASVAKQYARQFPRVRLLTVEKVFGNWDAAQATQINDGGVFDQISRR